MAESRAADYVAFRSYCLIAFAYYLVFTPASTYLEHYLTDICRWNEYLVTILNMLVNFITEFLYQRFVVFRGSLDTNDIAVKDTEGKNPVTPE